MLEWTIITESDDEVRVRLKGDITERVTFDDLEEYKRPSSEDPSFSQLWTQSGGEDEMVVRTVQRWRAQGK